MLRVLPPTLNPVNKNLICCKTGLMWVENKWSEWLKNNSLISDLHEKKVRGELLWWWKFTETKSFEALLSIYQISWIKLQKS